MKTAKKTGMPAVDTAIEDTVRDFIRWVPVGTDGGRYYVVTAGAEFSVQHKAGEKPVTIHSHAWQEGQVFATEDNQKKWTKDSVALTASVAGDYTIFVGVI